MKAIVAVAAFAALVGCSPDRRESVIPEGRVVQASPPKLDATSAERFGSMKAPPVDPALSGDALKPFDYELPAGWTELPPASFRDLNLGGPDGIASWVTIMGPGAGGPLMNLERWRGQLGLPTPSQADVDALPKVKVLGEDALRVDITAPDATRRLVGAMLFQKSRSVFVRISGTPDAVAGQLAAYEAFERSLADHAADATPRQPTEPTVNPVMEPAAGGSAASAGGYAWVAPEGWAPKGPGAMKVYEFQVGDARAWLTDLGGDGGGLVANVARWCGQVNRAPLTPEAVAALPTRTVLGVAATYVELIGDGADPALVGVVVPLGDHTLFVRLAGPSATVRAKQAEFDAFCASLQIKE